MGLRENIRFLGMEEGEVRAVKSFFCSFMVQKGFIRKCAVIVDVVIDVGRCCDMLQL